MEENRIPDSAISASSSYEEKSVGPQNARINQERNGGAWCPKAQISSEVREFLEVLAGNVNTYLVARQPLELPFVASRVRFIPFSEHPRTVCMRVELLGCPWELNIIFILRIPTETKKTYKNTKI
ncbi:Uncharacterized protein GBIM_11001 [Gryllus bimaculatus]|nr:Uncharacterized protein GBIM_11001 [Gryllus bimaculatus]